MHPWAICIRERNYITYAIVSPSRNSLAGVACFRVMSGTGRFSDPQRLPGYPRMNPLMSPWPNDLQMQGYTKAVRRG